MNRFFGLFIYTSENLQVRLLARMLGLRRRTGKRSRSRMRSANLTQMVVFEIRLITIQTRKRTENTFCSSLKIGEKTNANLREQMLSLYCLIVRRYIWPRHILQFALRAGLHRRAIQRSDKLCVSYSHSTPEPIARSGDSTHVNFQCRKAEELIMRFNLSLLTGLTGRITSSNLASSLNRGRSGLCSPQQFPPNPFQEAAEFAWRAKKLKQNLRKTSKKLLQIVSEPFRLQILKFR